MNIKSIASAFVSITALRIYLSLVVLLSAWNLYQLLLIPLSVLAQTGFTPIDYALYFLSALSMFSTVVGFGYIIYTPRELATVQHSVLMQILGIVAGIWLVADLLSTAIYMMEVAPGGVPYWFQSINGLLMSVINPVIVCGFALYILERYAVTERKTTIGAIVAWTAFSWVLLIMLGIILGAMYPSPVEVN